MEKDGEGRHAAGSSYVGMMSRVRLMEEVNKVSLGAAEGQENNYVRQLTASKSTNCQSLVEASGLGESWEGGWMNERQRQMW